jgi:hypothetical protein
MLSLAAPPTFGLVLTSENTRTYDNNMAHPAPPPPITISVAYDWAKPPRNRSKGLGAQWAFLNGIVRRVKAEVEKRGKKKPGEYPLQIRAGRLRGKHGADLLKSVVERISRSDVLVFDISGHNPNVMFELGCAVGIHGVGTDRIFVLADAEPRPFGVRLCISERNISRAASIHSEA